MESQCDFCGNRFTANSPAAKTLTVYQNPFTDIFDSYHFCNEKCLEEYERRYRDDSYSYCPECDRMITANDDRTNHFRCLYGPGSEEVDDIMCEACYERRIIEQGQPAIDFANKWLRGGLWADRVSAYGRAALHGQYITISDYCLNNEMTAARCNLQARKMMEQGHKLLMVYMGSSKTGKVEIVSVMMKRKES
jgi:hypothetical protein